MDAKEGRRLQGLVDGLTSDLGYATGKRKFPRPVSLNDAVTIASVLQREADRGVEAREVAIHEQGMTVACKRGCTGCCEEPIMVFRPEAIQVARWLKRPEHAAARDAFLAAYPVWKERAGDTPAQLSELFLGDPARYREVHHEGWRKRAMCAFNHDGDCTIYPVRPIVCRRGHALTTSEHCTGASPQPAARASFVPLDELVLRARTLLAATHNAIGAPRGRIEALCDAVHDLVAARP